MSKSRKQGRRLLPVLALACLGAVTALHGASAQSSKLTAYKPVTDERLANPEPENWLQYRGNYRGWGYSPLDQITSANIGRLTPMWSYSTGKLEGHQAPPIVNNGVMFASTPQNQVIALNAKTGDLHLDLQARTAGGTGPASPDQPWRRALWRQGLSRHRGRLRGGAQRQDRRSGLGEVHRATGATAIT